MAYKIKGDVEVQRGLGLGSMTTAQRTAYTPALAGYTVYDSDLKQQYLWDGAAWVTSSADRVYEKITQTAHGLAVKDVVYHNGTAWVKAVASVDSSTAQAIVTKVIDVNTFEITTHGVVTLTAHGLTVGNYYWLSQTVAGLATATQPSSGISQGVLFVRDANTVFVDVEQPINVSAGSVTTAPLGRAGAYRTTVQNPGNGNAVTFETLSNSTVGMTQALTSAGTVDLVAGKTYKLSAGVRLETPATAPGFSHWFIRTTTGTNISGQISLDSSSSTTQNATMSNTEVIYTPTTNETIGLYLDVASNLGEAGPGTYLNVEELPSSAVVPASGLAAADHAASGYMDLGAMRIQWGTNTQTTNPRTVTLPAAFSSNSYSVSVTPQGATNNTSGNIAFTEVAASRSTTAFGGDLVYTGGAVANASESFTWIAIGLK